MERYSEFLGKRRSSGVLRWPKIGLTLLLPVLLLLPLPCGAASGERPAFWGPVETEVNLEAAFAAISLNNYRYGKGADFDSATRGDKRLGWCEGYLLPTARATLPVGESTLYAEYSFAGAATIGDGEGGHGGEADIAAETALVGWRSGSVLGWLGEDGLGARVGRGRLVIGDGFLVGDGAADGGGHAAYRLNPRRGFAKLASLEAKAGAVYGGLFALESDKDSTRAVGIDANLHLGGYGTAGAAYVRVTDSDLPGREGMSAYEARYSGAPLAWLTDRFTARLEAAVEKNSGGGGVAQLDASAVSAELAYLLPWWKTRFSMSYNLFSGDKTSTPVNEAFDPLFQSPDGLGNLGWRPGEIVGNYFYTNSNLVNVTTALSTRPAKAIGLTAAFYHLDVDHKHLFGEYMGNIHLGDELDIYLDAQVSQNLSIHAVYGHAWTGDGPRALGFTGQQDLVQVIARVGY